MPGTERIPPTLPDQGHIPAGGDGADLIGQNIGDYRLVRQITGGGMAWVYEACSKKWPRRLVVKLPSGGRLASVEAKIRFQREIRAVTELSHPNIVTVLDYGEAEGVPFMVMNLVEGQPLGDWLAEENPDLGVRLTKFIDLCRTVASVHREGKVHRDLKPGNVVVDKHGEPHLLDFGLVRPLSGPSDLTAENTRMGTPNCMAPEQAEGSHQVGPQADVYSLGVILHWMLSGRYPIPLDDLNDEDRFWAIRHKPPTKPGAWNPNLPSQFDDLALQCLEKEPARRPVDAADLCERLEQVLRQTKAALADWAQTKVPTARGNGQTPDTAHVSAGKGLIESAGGAVPLRSPFYLERPADSQFLDAAARAESVILIQGPRQIGKTSLLARGLDSMRHSGRKVVLMDLQAINTDVLGSLKSLYLHLGSELADQLGLPDSFRETWDDRRPANTNFERFLTRKILAELDTPLVWAMDEIDRLFPYPYNSELFGMFRSWHNARALNPDGPWARLTLALAYASEARLFITDLNQSPFNIGVRVDLEDFRLPELNDLNRRHREPLASPQEVQGLYDLVGGHPFLVRVAFNHLARQKLGIANLAANCLAENGPFAGHLRHATGFIQSDSALLSAIASLREGQGCASTEAYYQLRSAGLIAGDSPRKARFRCCLYERFFDQLLAK